MLSALREFLIKPDTFFQGVLNKKVNIGIPIIIVFIVGIMGPLFNVYPLYLVKTPETYLIAFILCIVAFITLVFVWLLATFLFYFMSLFFGGAGTFDRCIEVFGYGFLPQIIGGCVNLVLIISIFGFKWWTIPFYKEISLTIFVLSIVWSAYYWIYGIKRTRQLSLRHATICVILPVIIFGILPIIVVEFLSLPK